MGDETGKFKLNALEVWFFLNYLRKLREMARSANFLSRQTLLESAIIFWLMSALP
ncbi:hypothetical protein PMPD1_3797 [Paramixta manurensis]|uniref:Uncharacterized protein n=1 Tax=Paramixta manurensis TaxID=2740817 RepID=A0A6M8UFW2_9GAMM|nr:hypothetical protein PMPD1_3797 [Erwiniaceae bacterium PD-1]